MIEKKQQWTLIIKPTVPFYRIPLREIWQYRDLVGMFVKRDFAAQYKQTILGPLWFILQPLLTTAMFFLIFTKVAKVPTGGLPPVIFYLSGLVLWNFFSTSLTTTAATFTSNTNLFGKVYFPRLIVPVSSVISGLISMGVQFLILMLVIGYYVLFRGLEIHPGASLLYIPLIFAGVILLSLGYGIIIASLTAKYRDLVFLINFGIQLYLYITPVIYPLSFANGKYQSFIMANPLTAMVETFRYAMFGTGGVPAINGVYSALTTFTILILGMILFNRVERKFMDTI